MTTLSEKMEFDHVVRVLADGTVEDTNELAPEVCSYEDESGTISEELLGDDWTLLSGFTAQHDYNGPVMHPSEYIGGGLERHILEVPGLYVSLLAVTDDGYAYGWLIAFKGEESK